MFRRLLGITACCTLAAAAAAGPISTTPGGDGGPLPDPSPTRGGVDIPIDIFGAGSWDLLGDPDNFVMIVDVAAELGLPSGTPVSMSGLGWDVSLRTVGSSWLSQAEIYFDEALNPDLFGIFLAPGGDDTFPGRANYSSGGVIDFGQAGFPNIDLPDGRLRIEFYEVQDDFPDALDARWGGTLTIRAVPEPGALWLLALAGTSLLRRR